MKYCFLSFLISVVINHWQAETICSCWFSVESQYHFCYWYLSAGEVCTNLECYHFDWCFETASIGTSQLMMSISLASPNHIYFSFLVVLADCTHFQNRTHLLQIACYFIISLNNLENIYAWIGKLALLLLDCWKFLCFNHLFCNCK